MKKVLVLYGPNLNLLGYRDPSVYGTVTLEEINAALRKRAAELGLSLVTEQRNGEGELIDLIHRYATGEPDDRKVCALIVNPGAYSHTSLALRDALEASFAPAIEVHLSNIHAREEFRRHSLTAEVCRGVIAGLGSHGFLLALEAVARMVEEA